MGTDDVDARRRKPARAASILDDVNDDDNGTLVSIAAALVVP